jgi:hypothetical protein
MWRAGTGSDWSDSPFWTLFGLVVMGEFVSLGAPFWNDVLKGMMGVLNGNGQKL